MDRLTSVQLFIQNAKVWDLNLFCENENQGLSPIIKEGHTFVMLEKREQTLFCKQGKRIIKNIFIKVGARE